MKTEFENLKKKYNLPSFDDLNKEFQIDDIENENSILKEIRGKILEKSNTYAKFLEDLLQPDTTPSSFYECTILNSENEKKTVFELYKKLMIIDRAGLETNLLSSDELEAEFIKKTYEEWLKIKQKLLEIVTLVRKSWEKEDVYTQFKGEYLG